MAPFTTLGSLKEVEEFLHNRKLCFLYISRPECNVCHAIWPKLRSSLLNQYPQIHLGYVDANLVEEVASKLLIFAVPSMLLFIGNKEYVREDRFVRFDLLEERLNRMYSLYAASDQGPETAWDG